MAEINSDEPGPVVEDATAGRGNSKPKKSGKEGPAEGNLEKCPCGESQGDYWKITCIECTQMWHTVCVGLKGLAKFDKGQVEEVLTEWVCPLCYVLPAKVVQATGIIHVGHRRDNAVKKNASVMKNNVSCTPHAITMLETLHEFLPTITGAVKKVVEEVVQAEEGKKEEAQTTLWSNLFKKEMETSKSELVAAVTKAAPSETLVRTVVSETAGATITNSLKKLDNDHVERRKRRFNLLLHRVKEDPSDDGEVRKIADKEFLVKKLGIPEESIVTVFRPGTRGARVDEKTGLVIPRPMVVKLTNIALADEWHNNGRGLFHNGYYINQDLCKADREAIFRAKDEREKRKNTDGKQTQSAT